MNIGSSSNFSWRVFYLVFTIVMSLNMFGKMWKMYNSVLINNNFRQNVTGHIFALETRPSI